MTCTAAQTPTWEVWAMDSDRNAVRDMKTSVRNDALGVKTRMAWPVSAPPQRGPYTPGHAASGLLGPTSGLPRARGCCYTRRIGPG